MLTVTELMGETAEAEVSLGPGKVLRVVFRPDALTAELEEEFHRRAEGERYIDALAYFLSQTLVDWGVVDGKKKVKPTYQFLRKLGVGTLMRIFEAVREASGLGNEAEVVKDSGGGSSLAAT